MAQLLKDPVDETTVSQQVAKDDELKAVFDISNLKMSDFKAAALKDARSHHPFDGYPDRKVQIGSYMKGKREEALIVNLTHILVFKEEVKQDPSGQTVSLGYPEMRNNEGKVVRPSTESTGTIITAHNRRAKDYESGGVDVDCVFDRTIKTADGELAHCCIIPSPSVRAQIVFKYNSKTQRVEHDPRYLMADPDQVSRLRRIFEMIINPRIRLEESIRKNFDEGGDTYRSSTLAGIPTGE
jgi:hypothetical protein